MSLVETVIEVLGHSMELGERTADLSTNTLLFGEMPEFDSLALVVVLTSLEERFKVQLDVDGLDEADFETIGSLTAFVERQIHADQPCQKG